MENVENQVVGQETAVDAAVTDALKSETEGQAVESEGLEGDADDGGAVQEGELKTVRKALDKRNRYINNQRNRIRSLEAEIQKLRDGSSKDKPSAPELEKFDSVLDYMEAKNTHTVETKLADQENNRKIAELDRQKAYERSVQDQAIADNLGEIIRIAPDAQKVFTANKAVIEAMPDSINELFYEIDDAPAAIYALAKEGRLQDLYSMPPYIAAAHLVQAEIRGQQYLQQSAPVKKPIQPIQAAPPVQQPPKPIGALKGAGKSSKALKDLSPDEVVQRYMK